MYAFGRSVIYVISIKIFSCAMEGLYKFKQLVGKNEIDHHLSANNWIVIIV